MKIKPNSRNPIADLIASGATPMQLATAWGYSSTSAITQLKQFEFVPPGEKAEKMAKSFGWASAGVVVDFWLKRSKARKRKGAKS